MSQSPQSSAALDQDAVTISPEVLRRMPLPRPDESADKDGRGSVLVVGGSPELIGAAILAGVGALRAGAGRLRIAVPASIAPFVGLSVVEARVIALPETDTGGIAPEAAERIKSLIAGISCTLVGPGLADDPALPALLSDILSYSETAGKPLVLDAAALAVLPHVAAETLRSARANPILTPHVSEMAKLLEMDPKDISADLPRRAREAAGRYRATVALKGDVTWIASSESDALYKNEAGNVGLATSGSGDTLAGIIAGLAARGAAPVAAACWGVHAHAVAGDRLLGRYGQVGFLARELLGEIPGVLRDLSGEQQLKA